LSVFAGRLNIFLISLLALSAISLAASAQLRANEYGATKQPGKLESPRAQPREPFEDAMAAYKNGDYATAQQLFRPLANDGREDAQFYLGYMYATGKGVAQDYTEAAKWFRLAADQGHAFAQYALGRLYLDGDGVKQDHVVAYMWFELSAAQGTKVAITARDGAAKKMTPTQIAEAQNLARAWQPKPHREVVDMRQFPWSSIGKVFIAGRQSCTGAVIGPNQFLTAAHCLYLERTAHFMRPESIHILLGYEKGEYRVHRVISQYTIPPAFDPVQYSPPLDAKKLVAAARYDWAIMYVDEPFPADVKPLHLATATPSPGTALKVDGYPKERPYMMTADPHCRVVRTISEQSLIVHDCVTHSGDSGGPVFSRDDEGLILGVTVLGPDLHVHFEEQSKKWGAAVSAASISQFLASH
jgi:protease YdgD